MPSRLARRVAPGRTLATLCVLFLALLLLPAPADAQATGWARTAEALLYAGFGTLLFHALTQRRLLAATLLFLALPYFLFAASWLQWPVALPVMATLGICLWRALKSARTMPGDSPAASATASTASPTAPPLVEPTVRSLLCFAVVVLWVHLSGAGGFGYQSVDYQMHNGRLQDLVQHAWPVRYGQDQNLVFYLGYYLPAALVGKAFGYAIAQKALYLWTLVGVWQALLWLARLAGRRLSVALAVTFALFGALDLVGYWYARARLVPDGSYPLLPADLDHLCFWTSYAFQHFVGNYLSTTFQLYWAPHQVIAGWLVAAVVTSLFWQRRFESLVFAYSLLFFWSPLIALGLLPYLAVLLAASARHRWRELLSLQNLLAPAVLLVLFALFYAGGSAGTNPIAWIPSRVKLAQADFVLLFYGLGFGVHLLAIAPTLRHFTPPQRVTLLALTANLLVAPLVSYGAFSDLFCRATAPLMFLLLVVGLRAAERYRPLVRRCLLLPLLLLASGSAVHQFQTSIHDFGATQRPVSAPHYHFAYENLGPDSSFFARHLAR